MPTKSGIRCSGFRTHDYVVYEVKLPNGRKIEILTKEGADEFIEAVGTDFISRNLTATNDAELSTTYMIMSTVVGSASPEKIADGFPEPELHTFVEHTRDTLDILSTDRTWLRSVCVPAADPERSAGIVKCLQTCLQLVKKKLKSGTPTGDILDAVIAGKDGPINEKAKCGLVRLQSLARLSNDNYGGGGCTNEIKACSYCDMLETQMYNAKLMKCQRWKQSYYCSKECQVADWKSHKKSCKQISSMITSRSKLKTLESTKEAFVDSNYVHIAIEVYEKTQKYNVPKKELLVEIDFYGDAPALRNEFKVWLTSNFLKGSSVADAPGWFRTHSDKTLKRLLREEYKKVTSDPLLAVCRAGNSVVSVSRLYWLGDETGCQLFSDEAVEAIGRGDYAVMVAYLGQDTTASFGIK